MTSITFEDSAKLFVLEAFGKTTNDQCLVVEKDNINNTVHTVDGQEIKLDKFAGIRKGSEIYIKSDIISLIELADIIKEKQA